MSTTTITFDFGAYDGRPVLDETPADTESLDFGAYGGRPVVTKETAAGGTTIRWPWQHRRHRRTGAA